MAEPGSRGGGVKRRSASAAKPIDGAQPCCIPGRKNYGACMKRTRISRATAASRQPHIMPDGNFNTRHLSTLFLTFPKSRLDVAPIHKHVYFPALLRVLTQRGQKATATIALNVSTCIPLLLGQNWIRQNPHANFLFNTAHPRDKITAANSFRVTFSQFLHF